MEDYPIVWQRLSQPTQKRFLVIAAISHQKLSLNKLIETTGIPASTLRRIIRVLRVEFAMDVRYINTVVSSSYDQEGYYKIEHWGLIDEEFFKSNVTKILPLK